MTKRPIFVLVEFDGQPAETHKMYPGDTTNVHWTVHIEPGFHPLGQKKIQHIRLTVPREDDLLPDGQGGARHLRLASPPQEDGDAG